MDNSRFSDILARWRTSGFFLFWMLSLAAFRQTLETLIHLSLHDSRYSHLVVIPFISFGIIVWERKRIFSPSRYDTRLGIPSLVLAALLYGVLPSLLLGREETLSLVVSVMILTWMAGFLFFYGARSFQAAVFPLFFLLFLVPIPPRFLELVESFLQRGSAGMTHLLFKVAAVPVFRDGLKFSLPGVEIEVAQQCSGIRSSIAVLIAAMLAGHVFLRSSGRKLALLLLTIPVVIFKNALRIATISWLAVHVSPDYFHGRLHRQGGLPFALVAVAILMVLLLVLQRTEAGRHTRAVRPPGSPQAG